MIHTFNSFSSSSLIPNAVYHPPYIPKFDSLVCSFGGEFSFSERFSVILSHRKTFNSFYHRTQYKWMRRIERERECVCVEREIWTCSVLCVFVCDGSMDLLLMAFSFIDNIAKDLVAKANAHISLSLSLSYTFTHSPISLNDQTNIRERVKNTHTIYTGCQKPKRLRNHQSTCQCDPINITAEEMWMPWYITIIARSIKPVYQWPRNVFAVCMLWQALCTVKETQNGPKESTKRNQPNSKTIDTHSRMCVFGIGLYILLLLLVRYTKMCAEYVFFNSSSASVSN